MKNVATALKILKMTPKQFFQNVITVNDTNRNVFSTLVARLSKTEDDINVNPYEDREIREEALEILKQDLVSMYLCYEFSINKIGTYGLSKEGVIL